MLLTIPTNSVTLDSLLTTADKAAANKSRNWVIIQNVYIQNLWSQSIFIEFWTDAIVTNWVQIKQDEWLAFTELDLEDCRLISETAENTNVRIIFN